MRHETERADARTFGVARSIRLKSYRDFLLALSMVHRPLEHNLPTLDSSERGIKISERRTSSMPSPGSFAGIQEECDA
jgi:hypothetical protein